MSGRDYLGCLGVAAFVMLLGGAGLGTVAVFIFSKVGGVLVLLAIAAIVLWLIPPGDPPASDDHTRR
jgi:hypothetical protein